MYFEYSAQPRALQVVVDEYTVIPIPTGEIDQVGFGGDGLVLKVTLVAKTPEKLTEAKQRPVVERIAEALVGDILQASVNESIDIPLVASEPAGISVGATNE